MPASTMSRLLALMAIAALVVAGACNRGGDDDEAEATDPPERTPSVEAVSDFQLVGTIDEAFAGQAPPVAIPSGTQTPVTTEAPATGSPGTTPALTPAGTPVGEMPLRGGIIRLEIDAASQGLTDACGIGEGSIVHLYWTTSTFFDPPDVLDDVEDRIEDRTAGISGTVYRASGLPDVEDVATPSPTAAGTGSPAASPAGTPASPTPGAQAADCLLVAEQIGFGRVTLPTPRPAARRTATPATPAPTPTPEPTEEPEDTTEPTESPDDTPDPTDSPEPT